MLSAKLSHYVESHFIDEAAFLEAAHIDSALFHSLIATSAFPGAIYRIWASGTVWSPIGGWIGEETGQAPQTAWYSPAAVWWARRAAVLIETGLDPEAAGQALQAAFLSDFLAALETMDIARYAYPEVFANGALDHDFARSAGVQEWEDWIEGGYGVCLRRFDARSLVVKAGETERIKHLIEDGKKQTLSPAEKLVLLDAMEKLDAVMLPFAPHQRPKGTPGFWIDTPLAKYRMGAIPLVESLETESPALLCA